MENNIAFIDGQNLHLGTTKLAKSWKVDLKRFRIYLEQKYEVSKAYYYLGFTNNEHHRLYKHIQESGFILEFKPHKETLLYKRITRKYFDDLNKEDTHKKIGKRKGLLR
jgi:hypothetical protein